MANTLDAELNDNINYYTIELSATDSGSRSVTGSIQVDIGDINEFPPVFNQTFETVSVAESATAGTRYVLLKPL